MATNIEWTHTVAADGSITKGETWNPTTGCTKISQGCKFCYAEVMHKRLTGMGQLKYAQAFSVFVEHPAELTREFGRKPKRIFINSMSDLFHEKSTLAFNQQVFAAIARQPQHTFIALTKRAELMAERSPLLDWPPNLWMGVSIEDYRVVDRAGGLHACGAKVKFLSIEPLIGSLKGLKLRGLHWVIVGGESGPNARLMDRFMLDQVLANCGRLKIPLFVKQMGTALASAMNLVDTKGGDINEWPAEYRIRQFPETK